MLEAFLYINIAQSLFAAVIILTKKPLSIPDKFLSIWLFFVACMFGLKLITLVFPDQIENQWFRAGLIIITFPPFLYLYSKYLVKGGARFKNYDLVHFIPFVALVPVVVYLSFSGPENSLPFNENGHLKYFTGVFGVVFLATFLGYGIATIKLIKQYLTIRDDYYSYHNSGVNSKWIRSLVFVFYSYYTIVILLNIVKIFVDFSFQLNYIIVPAYTLFIYIVSYRGYSQAVLLGSNKPVQKEKAYQKSGLKAEDVDQYVKVILQCMEDEKPWLNDKVTVNDIAVRTQIPKHHITQVLNERLNKNFYTLVNEYRTEEAIRLFGIEKYHKWTLESIAYEAGFNSKSSFNNFFKKHKGQTPSEYRKTME